MTIQSLSKIKIWKKKQANRLLRNPPLLVPKGQEISNFLDGSHQNIAVIGAGPTGLLSAIIFAVTYPNVKLVILEKRLNDLLSINFAATIQPQHVLRSHAPKLYQNFAKKYPALTGKNSDVVNRVSLNQALLEFLKKKFAGRVCVVQGEDVPKVVMSSETQIASLTDVSTNFQLILEAGGASNGKNRERVSYPTQYIGFNIKCKKILSNVKGKGTLIDNCSNSPFVNIVVTNGAKERGIYVSLYLKDEFCRDYENVPSEMTRVLIEHIKPYIQKHYPNKKFQFEESQIKGTILDRPPQSATLVSEVCFRPVQAVNNIAIGTQAGSTAPSGLSFLSFLYGMNALLKHIDDVKLGQPVFSDLEKANLLNIRINEGHIPMFHDNVTCFIDNIDLEDACRKVFLKLYSEKIYGLWEGKELNFMDELEKRLRVYLVDEALDLVKFEGNKPNILESDEIKTLKEKLFPSHEGKKFLDDVLLSNIPLDEKRSKIHDELQIDTPHIPEGYEKIDEVVFVKANNQLLECYKQKNLDTKFIDILNQEIISHLSEKIIKGVLSAGEAHEIIKHLPHFDNARANAIDAIQRALKNKGRKS